MTAALNLGLIILLTGLIALAMLRFFWSFRHRRLLAPFLLTLSATAGLLCTCAAVTAIGMVDYLPLGPKHGAMAEIDMRQSGRSLFQIRLIRPGKADWQHDFRGSRLCLAVHEVDWRTPALVIGLRSMYRLAGISSNRGAEARPPSRERLSLWRFSRRHIWLFWIKARPPLYQCLPMTTGARYRLMIGSGLIITQPLNAEAGNALQQRNSSSSRNGVDHDI